MKTRFLIAAGIFLAALANTAVSIPAQAKSMKDCAADWKQMKAANQTGGKTYREFSKECMSGDSGSPVTAAPATAAPAPATVPPAAKTTKPVSSGRQAMIARERACGADWKADKAAGKTAGMKWPQYWSACNKRKKTEGM